MDTMTMTKSAVSCVAFVRPRPADQVIAADAPMADQGISLSVAPALGLRGHDAPFRGVVRVAAGTYLTSDVARSLLGRPPV